MKIDRFLRAALVGLTISAMPLALSAPSPAMADTLRVVKKGVNTKLNVPMNRAVVVESDIPFAELSIANPNIADISSLSDRTIYVLGKSPGLTTLTLLDASGQLIANVDVRVAAEVSEFKERLRQILPGEKIEVRTANDGIVLSGVVSSTQRLQRALDLAERYAPERVSNLMSVGGIQQVMLKVRFAEMQRNVSKSLGASLSLNGAVGGTGINGGTGTTNTSGSVATALGGNIPNLNQNAGAVLFGFNAGSTQVGILLEALEQKGVVRFLAEPNLVALSGQEAKFLAGGEYPVPVAQSENRISIEFKPFGVELSFIPRVVDKDLVNLELKAAVSAIDPTTSLQLGNGIEIAAFTRRETSSTVELRDGESFAIAGLLKDDFTDNATQLPWLGDVPVLGALFRSADYQRNQTELVIIVTAHLVTPTRGEALALPTDRIRPPTEKDLFLYGRTADGTRTPKKGAAGEVAKQDFGGSYGYVLD
ncbi:type II and III secretion system protein family protein [Sulfitobacter mediterraneus]|jgi:pilus assembly protein CpaC|uniref:General secretion pathway protein n=1 Tax=Sulfitobacter mediterraneus TaxID=83219 RepID=A0A061SS22_9RHOB|nr:type II and III secretion system protein family protein [Sulfitobacter mediterraneus]KAJ02159.1 general secretion pathway protein [Sulfitobacter mediterraneus]KIN79405.1 Bacterial type II/III secretion system protein [Sulfitobacter mediterraneus KCTC 32188]MBM1311732.1 type II and III secretion system protein family protein [Sulfitobacter mediterraneus]MBM1315614.1 type II and III secretion system protein family protein [Sulfitobacter mediterraneus]MBM1323975.1 type II and III secretion sys